MVHKQLFPYFTPGCTIEERLKRIGRGEIMLTYEMQCWDQDYIHIAGVDEVGRGCLFGDVVAAAVILPRGLILEGVDDSKKLSEKKRDELFEVIMKEALAVGVGQMDVQVIEQVNIKQASRLAMKKAVEQLSLTPDYLLVDAETVDSSIPQMAIIHGDALSQSIAAASIIAKVTRDKLCKEWDNRFPEYGIAGHKGYATRFHRERLMEFGASSMHRMSFLRKILGEKEEVKQIELF
ncbi:ribonuclease HII [Paenibacillus swuensis]|uniref:Ribonuclease HII n=2 Tax=Paenibacillus swuensis TaxID=1178515 RepID=A0A172TKL8_9BACL|nr:ribonuclease HII [Paenibacillus swuensis]ANE47522.1 ribonuclease HII [Paenibacillus swuensis]